MTSKDCMTLAGRMVWRWITAGSLLAVAAGLAACVDDYKALELSRPETRHVISYTSRTEALLVEVPPGAHGLSANQEADVWQFIARYKVESNGNLRLSTPYASRQHATARASLNDIREIAREQGVPPGRIVVGRHAPGARSTNAVKLAYDKPVALPPECADWSEDVGRTRERLHYPHFGCATQRNLALNVANSRDLQRPQEEQPGSAERFSVNWTKYVGAGSAAANAGAAQPSVGADSKPGKPVKN
jgi:pilus assembly protein CpaD